MTTSADIRQVLADVLRLALVGPDPGNEHEGERLSQPPSGAYLTGFLVPWDRRVALCGADWLPWSHLGEALSPWKIGQEQS